MAEVRITAQPRTEFGKGYARRTRRAGLVPAVLYGHGEDVRHLSLSAREFAKALKGGSNTLLTVALDGETHLALPKAVTRHPIRPEFTHVDLLLVRRGEKVTVAVAVHLIGEPAPDTLVNQELTALTIEAEATHIPPSFDVSIAGKHVGQSILAGDIELPSGTTLVTEADNLVVGFLAAPTAEELEAELEEAEAEVGIERDASDEEIQAAAEAEAEAEASTDQDDDSAAPSGDSAS
ncbi:MAG: 50S ribosomal protein L25/general stress protein Ctc [Geodermatophilaceae bacterium]|jgi:large subunit ribosomal protein L25|nr:50S ribosomal protein L25/general stress protein Ctc [Geodermatophilaceae bacterium]